MTQDIGVITPFRQQVLTICTLLRAHGFSGVNVGAVENFQRTELKIILISAVLAHYDEQNAKNTKKFI